ncbi:S1 family peptidase [Mycolicibacterium pulveris]|uniref:S1 family peptidase n=1 Tax=Mycolicibacterium pulveris TaxID=36813 RepID=UPI003CEA3859
MSLDFFPRFATGQVLFAPPDAAWEFSGTGAMYLRPYVILTAAHCVPDVVGGRLGFKSPMESDGRLAEQVIRHPTIDLAALVVSKDAAKPPTGVYSEIGHGLVDGGDFIAFGYPAELGTTAPRLFKGHYQRHFEYQSPDGHKYFAAELSIPAPAGLSGGPVSNAHRPQVLDAIVTANHDSSAVIDSFEEEERDGKVWRGKITRVVSYGIAAMLVPPDVQEWVDTVVALADADTPDIASSLSRSLADKPQS